MTKFEMAAAKALFESEVRRQEFFGHSREQAEIAAASKMQGGISGCAAFDADWVEATRLMLIERGLMQLHTRNMRHKWRRRQKRDLSRVTISTGPSADGVPDRGARSPKPG